MMRNSAIFSLLGGASVLGLAACGGAPSPQSPPRDAPTAQVTPAASAGPAPVVEPARAPAATASAVPVGAAAPSPFHVIGELVAELELHSAGDRGFLLSQQGIELQLVGDEIVQDPLFKRGLPSDALFLAVSSVGGRYPDAFWLATTQATGRSGFSTLWNWDGKNWRQKQAFRESYFTWGVEPWVGGRMLALEVAGMLFDARFHVLSGDARIAAPQFQKAPKREDFSYCVTHMNPSQFKAFPSGEVIVAGLHCKSGEDSPELAVERWAPGAKQSTIDILPGIHGTDEAESDNYAVTGLAPLSPTDIYLAATRDTLDHARKRQTTPYFAHFDGKNWQALPSPIPNGVSSMWTEPGGTLFASNFEGGLWSRTKDGKWSPISWPAKVREAGNVQVLGMWAHAPGDTWAVVQTSVGDTSRKRFLLHTRPAVAPFPTVEAMDRKDRSLRLPGPPVDWCSTPFVLLYTLGRQAPKDFDYPATRQALKGHREFANAETQFVEFEREGRRYFGARVPDFKWGAKLAKLVKDKVAGSTPELVCLDPVESRKMEIDFSARTKKN